MDTKTLCLAVLNRGDASGYEIKKQLEEPPFSHFQDTGFGSIYPALTALANEGLIEGRAMVQERRPDKKVYSIQPAGRSALSQALRTPPGPDKLRSDFLFVMFFAELLPEADLRRTIDERIAYYEERISAMEGCSEDLADAPPGRGLVHGFGLSLYRTARDYLISNRDRFLNQVANSDRAAAE